MLNECNIIFLQCTILQMLYFTYRSNLFVVVLVVFGWAENAADSRAADSHQALIYLLWANRQTEAGGLKHAEHMQ